MNNRLSDLDFIYLTILENHPGVYNDQDKDFNSHLKQAYVQAKNNLSFATNIEEQKIVLNEFIYFQVLVTYQIYHYILN
ncbi:MAG: hypothetical protein LBL17_04655 [Coxiellaceae bacterium]|nr:hypothetical protein [Coxiellaceae bacterium]